MPRTPRAASLALPKPLPGDIKPFLPIIIWALEALIAFLKTLQVAPKEESL